MTWQLSLQDNNVCVVAGKVDQRVTAHMEITGIMKLSCVLKIIIFRTSGGSVRNTAGTFSFLTRYKFRSAIVNISF